MGGLPRWFNVVAGALGLSLLAPFLAHVWLLVRLDSPGGAIFRQRRTGRNGRVFTCYKFRTMKLGSQSPPPVIQDFRAFLFSPEAAGRDPRLTGIGAVLRRTSVDELPQLLNVVRGEMALVGPRPELPEIAAQYPPEFLPRHSVLPGITGLAQVRGRSNLTYLRGLTYDRSYVEHRSPGLDILILARTCGAVVRGVGAR